MSKLYLVPTPLGNLEDITFRALRVLKEVDFILAEDKRVSATLLAHYGIETPMLMHHQHNEHQALKGIINLLSQGKNLALISDAGTPSISDPGFLLVRECLKNGFDVECLPGAVAFIPALVVSGLPCERFIFEGFLPQKKGRESRIQALRNEERTMVFYEAPHRILKTLKQFEENFGGERKCSVSRELTKIYETTFRGTISEGYGYFTLNPPRGEFVIIVAGINYYEKRA
jgi:16S rRNA (cytidine1402-2'-O)-methyltransferase